MSEQGKAFEEWYQRQPFFPPGSWNEELRIASLFGAGYDAGVAAERRRQEAEIVTKINELRYCGEQVEEIRRAYHESEEARAYAEHVADELTEALGNPAATITRLCAELERGKAARAGLVEAATAVVEGAGGSREPEEPGFFYYRCVGTSLIERLRACLAAPAGTPSAPGAETQP